jgi:hypothetical protein
VEDVWKMCGICAKAMRPKEEIAAFLKSRTSRSAGAVNRCAIQTQPWSSFMAEGIGAGSQLGPNSEMSQLSRRFTLDAPRVCRFLFRRRETGALGLSASD